MFRKKSILGARMRRAGIDISVGIGQFVFDKLIECGYANANVVIEIGLRLSVKQSNQEILILGMSKIWMKIHITFLFTKLEMTKKWQG